MKCILLCAGYATRLYPLTLDRPKPLLPVAGKPMIEHILDKIKDIEDIDEILIVTNNKFFNNFRSWKRKYSFSKPIKILNDNTNSNDDRLGAVGDIHHVIEKEGIEENILVIGGDNIFKFDLKEMFGYFRQKNESVIALYDIKDKSSAAERLGVVELDENNMITNFEEKPKEPKTSLVSTACYILSEHDVELLKKSFSEGKKHDNIGEFIKILIDHKDVYGLIFEEKWFDIGTPKQLKEADIEWSLK